MTQQTKCSVGQAVRGLFTVRARPGGGHVLHTGICYIELRLAECLVSKPTVNLEQVTMYALKNLVHKGSQKV